MNESCHFETIYSLICKDVFVNFAKMQLMNKLIYNSNIKRFLLTGNFELTKDEYRIVNIVVLNITGNFKLSYFNANNFPNVIQFILSNNSIKNFSRDGTNNSNILQFIDLSSNPIENIDFLKKLSDNQTLAYLDLSLTKIHSIKYYHFEKLKFLKILKIANCKLQSINIRKLNLENLLELHFNNSIFPSKYGIVLVKSMKEIKKIYSSSFNLCCLSWFYILKSIECFPSTSLFQTCSSLLGSNILKAIFWFYGLFGFSANILSFFFLLKKQLKNIAYNISLNFGDFLCSIYILSICSADKVFEKNYLHYDLKWRSGRFCKVLGSLFYLSTLISGFSLVMISLQKLFAVKYPMKMFYPTSQLKLIIFTFLCFAFLISLLPNILYQVNS